MGITNFGLALERAAYGQERRQERSTIVTLPGGRLTNIWQHGRNTRQGQQMWSFTLELWGSFFETSCDLVCTSWAWTTCADHGFL
jgi:hypothetical protein